jgi:hypothetical protein
MEYLVVRNKMPLFGSILHFPKEWNEKKGYFHIQCNSVSPQGPQEAKPKNGNKKAGPSV